MGASLLQLASLSTEDVFLTTDPQFSFFKIVYHRHSAFSLETKEYLVSSNFGTTSNFYIPTDGDLVSKIYLQVDIPEITFLKKVVDWETIKWKYYNITEQPYIPYYILQTNEVNTDQVSQTVAIQVQSDVGRVLNSEILSRIGIGLNHAITDIINDDTIFRDLLNLVSYFYSKRFSLIPSKSIINQMYTFYTNYSSINLQYVNNNSIFSSLLINYLINILIILYNNINAFETVIQVSLVNAQSTAFSTWKTSLSQYFSNAINIPTIYQTLNSYQLSSLLQSTLTYASQYVSQIDSQVENNLGITNIEQLNNLLSSYTSGFNEYLFDNLVSIGYDYYYLYDIYYTIAQNSSRYNLLTIQVQYQSFCNVKIIAYFYQQYLSNNVSSSSIRVSSLPDYSVVFKNAFIRIVDTIAQLDVTYQNIKNIYLIDLYNLVVESLLASNSITTQNLIDACAVARANMLTLINRFIYESFYLYNYQSTVLQIETFEIKSTTIEQFKKELFAYITEHNNSLVSENLIFKIYPFFFYNKDTYLLEAFRAAKDSALTTDELTELQTVINSITYENEYTILTSNPFTQDTLIDNIEILRDYVNTHISYYKNIYTEFNINKIIDDYTYLSNVDKILNLIASALGRNLTTTEINTFTTVIENFNTDNNESDLAIFINQYNINLTTVLSWFNKYPQHNQDITITTVQNVNPFKDTVILQSYLNDIFLEEMYYEYIFDKILVLYNVIYDKSTALKKRNEWFIKLKSISININLTEYEEQVLFSYHFFNNKEIIRKVPKLENTLNELYKTTDWIDKLTFLNIINFKEFIEYSRTNKQYFLYLYYEFIKKIKNKKEWKIVKVINKYNTQLTVVEEYYYTPLIEKITNNYSSLSYKMYLIKTYDNLNTKYETKIKKLLENNVSLKKSTVLEILTMNSLEVLTFGEGKHNISINSILTVIINQGYQVDFYLDKNYYRKITSIRNDNVFPIELTVKDITKYNLSIVNSVVITKIYTKKNYKGLYILDDYDILNNDIEINFDNEIILKRKVPDKDNVYLYYETVRWSIYNDYHSNLLVSKPIEKKYVSWINANITNPFAWVSELGHKLISSCELYIDDSLVDSVNSYWLNIYFNYFREISHKRGYDIMIGNVPSMTELTINNKRSYRLIIPIPFWFCKHNYLALPIISLTKTKVLLKFKYSKLEDLIVNYSENIITKGNIKTNVLIQYTFLDLEERMNFIKKKHYYLIERQKIFIERNLNQTMLKLKFNGPIIDIFLGFVKNNSFDYIDIIKEMKLVLNGKVINNYKDSFYYRIVVPYERYANFIDNVYVIPFSLYPTDPQPSGSMNFSYVNHGFIDYKLNVNDLTNIQAIIVGREFNILQVMSGQAALLFVQ